MIFNMVGGGGGSLKATDAVLRVIAPAESTVTITKSGVSKSDAGHENAIDNTLYDYYFIIHASQFDSVNPWTVTATLGDESISDTIVIDSANEYDMELSYFVYYFKSGNGQIVPFSTAHQSSGSVTFSETSIVVDYSVASNNIIRFNTTSAIDLSDFSAIVFDADVTINNPSTDPQYNFGFYVSQTLNQASVSSTKPSSYIARVEPSTLNERLLYSLDVSSSSASAYIGGWGNAKATIYNIYGVKE